MPKFQDLTGTRYGRLLVESRAKSVNEVTWWNCICDCGVRKPIRAYSLGNTDTKSCGCLKRDHPNHLTHGRNGTPEYLAWHEMKRRVQDSKRKAFKNYGGRGITICDRWISSFANFFEDMGQSPAGMTLDRIDNDRGYSKENCRWTDWKTRCNNKRNTIFLTIRGERKPISIWAEILGLSRATIYSRIRKGWDPEKVVSPLLKTKGVAIA